MVSKTAILSVLLSVATGTVLAQSERRASAPLPVPAVDEHAVAAQVAEAARQAAAGATATEQGFLEREAKRAAQITEQAKSSGEAATWQAQGSKLEEASRDHREWAREQLERAQGLATATLEQGREDAGNEPPRPARAKFLVFVSQSMGEAALASAFEFGRGNPEVMYVFRGFLPGQNPLQFQQAMVKFQQKQEDQIVPISLDPPAFRDYGVTRVPAVVMLDAEEKPISRVDGIANFAWLSGRVEAGERGDQGNRGTTFPVAEADLIEEMKAKAAAVDWEKEANAARERYFRELATLDLPYATEQRARRVEAVLEVRSDVVDQNGTVQHKAGDRIDMREHLAKAPVLVVFNSQDPTHVAFAKEVARKSDGARKVIFMTTRVDRDGGVAGYARQEFAIGQPVYLLMDDVRNTFGIERIPTVVTPLRDAFVVVEVPLTQGESANADHHTAKR